MVSIELSPAHSYPLGVALASALFPVIYLGMQVGNTLLTSIGKYRRLAGVPYPFQYATKEECEKDRNKLIFNCAQRAHYNYLESYPTFLVLLALGSIFYPEYAAGAGVVFLSGRVAYTRGYLSGDPSKRSQGMFQYLGTLTLLGLSITSILKIAQLL